MPFNRIFSFFAEPEDAELDQEFKQSYQAPAARYLAICFVLALLIFGVFYLLDAVNGVLPYFGGVQTVRLGILATLGLGAALSAWRAEWVKQHYTVLANITFFLALQAVAYVAYNARVRLSYIEMYWGMTSSLSTGFVVAYGFSRLRAINTALIVLTVTATAIFYALSLPQFHPAQFGRLVMHLMTVNVVAFVLRHHIEQRERHFFLLAKENLRRNVYTKELEAAKAAADEASQAKSRFLANMSHEVRTPMNGVLQILEQIGLYAKPGDAELIDKAKRSGDALLRILNSILDYTKLSNGALPVRPTAVSLTQVCQTVTELHACAVATKGLELKQRLDLGPSDERVIVDEVKLFEILNNLVSNAIKFTDRGFVELPVSVSRRPDLPLPLASLHIAVRDTGVGISDTELKKVFTPFYQVDSASTRKAGGTGLGLAIVKELVATLGGHIGMESKEGFGTAAAVVLPVQIEDAVNGPIMPREATKSDGVRVVRFTARPRMSSHAPLLRGRALLVEDNELNAVLAARNLEMLGLEVAIAENGAAALEEIQQCQYDVVLMDCQMPVMDGYEAARRIRSWERAHGRPALPIVALTANTLSGDREKCLSAGMTDYLGKPYTANQLRELLLRWLEVDPAHAEPLSKY